MSRQRKKLILAIVLIFTVNIFIIAIAQYASAELYKVGSSGSTVREIQTRLQKPGDTTAALLTAYTAVVQKKRLDIFRKKRT